MSSHIPSSDYRALAELRFRIRQFICEGDAAAYEAGLEPQQYLMLLALRGLPEGEEPTVRSLSERLMIKHHSTVELIDRMEKRGYVRRTRGIEDRREVRVSLLPKGQKQLDAVVRQRMVELRSTGKDLVRAIEAILQASKNGVPKRRSAS